MDLGWLNVEVSEGRGDEKHLWEFKPRGHETKDRGSGFVLRIQDRKICSVLDMLTCLSLIQYNDSPQRCRAELQRGVRLSV